MTNTIVYHVGDVRDAMRLVDDGLVALVVTSPPFLALRSYLPDDHPDKHREIGSEATPAAFIDTMLGLTADWRRIVAPWGSIAVELGDTMSGSGSPGGDYAEGGMRDGQPRTTYSSSRCRPGVDAPLQKSLMGIPTLYTWSLAYGRNLLTGEQSPAGWWRIRNLLTWTRPNPPVGALGDKFRPATSFVTVACVGGKRWFDLDAVRQAASPNTHARTAQGVERRATTGKAADDARRGGNFSTLDTLHDTDGAPPRDWWDANDLEADELAEHWRVERALADWQPLHRLPTSPYKGSHYATFPEALPRRLIEAMCPREVCTVCGVPRRRITGPAEYVRNGVVVEPHVWPSAIATAGAHSAKRDGATTRTSSTLGWTDCGHDAYTPGIVLDPFGGSGTTGVAAARAGRDAILVDLDARNRDLARARICEQLRLVDEYTIGTTTVWTVDAPLPNQRTQIDGQTNLLDLFEATA